MPFTTLSYIAFFAVVFFAYYAIPKRFQWWLLLAASMFFYGYASPFYILLLWGVIFTSYVGCMLIGITYHRRDAYLARNKCSLSREEKRAYKSKVETRGKIILCVTLVLLFGTLGVFKYAKFAIDNLMGLAMVFGLGFDYDLSEWNIILPIGLSFYIFQTAGYCIDVYREEVVYERSLMRHALFISYFPQILQGPIGKFDRLAPQLFSQHAFDYDQVVFGIQRIAWGFFKKLVIANRIANCINAAWLDPSGQCGFLTWVFISSLYAVQLYADFSGYMDIACGASQMFGVKIDENFDTPFFSKSIAEFWRRWHITLGAWFKSYLFYPLLRSNLLCRMRKKLSGSKYLETSVPTAFALLTIWTLIGLWHGADWSYVAYGLFHGIFIILGVFLQPIYDYAHNRFSRLVVSLPYRALQYLRTFLLAAVSFSIFKPADLTSTGVIWRSACTLGVSEWLNYLRSRPTSWLFCLLGVVIILFVDLIHTRHTKGFLRQRVRQMPVLARYAVYLLGLLAMVYFGVYGAGMDQFEYFKF